jgi:hypothetical protein
MTISSKGIRKYSEVVNCCSCMAKREREKERDGVKE